MEPNDAGNKPKQKSVQTQIKTMAKEIPNAGTYRASTSGAAIVVYEADSGSLCAALPVTLKGSEIAWSGKTTLVLGKNDGTLNTRTLDNLKAIFPQWDGDPFKLDELETSNNEFDVVCQHEEYDDKNTGDKRMGFKVQWVNPIGVGVKMPEKLAPDEVKSLKSKWGSKFKAVSKPSAPAKTAVAEKVPEKPAAPDREAIPSRAAAPQVKKFKTAEEVYVALQKNHDGKKEDEITDLWYAANDKLFGENVVASNEKEFTRLGAELGL